MSASRARRSVADTYRPDPQMERLLRLRRDDPAGFDQLSPTVRMALGYYVDAKTAHQAGGTTPPAA